ncbi:ABC-three component system protein [Archangium sp.]|uniref:ABC-three component system protein n=1 Tax=Archangium sp. TaxID=1872627 RepID=UPI002D71FC9F|nr:DUF2326 domain-containing protein [Archangium sp.]HYO59961.1 DUF2326 domain-containing protein [Archangium sp.]
MTSNKSSFRSVSFKPGFNVVLADRHHAASRKDSRNGVGKSTLLEIIHFCLGADARAGKGLLVPELAGWEFSLELTLDGREILATRRTDHPRRVLIEGDTSSWPVRPVRDPKSGSLGLDINSWNSVLGALMFGRPLSREKYEPSFRSLISYFIRRGQGAYLDPFRNFSRQNEVDRQVNVAFLLNLAWEDARQAQLLKDRAKGFSDLKKAVKAGVLEGYEGSVGDLEAKRVRLQEESEERRRQLESFRVHPQYRELEQRASELTTAIHALGEQNYSNLRLLELYQKDLAEEREPATDDVQRVYAEAGVLLAEAALRRLEEVESFHRSIVINRREFLAQEVERLSAEVKANEEKVARFSEERADLLGILQTHGALEEYTRLQRLYLAAIAKVKEVSTQVENMKRLNVGTTQVKLEKAMLERRARVDHEERAAMRERAVSLFNSNSQFLYGAPGKLIIDVVPNGFRFDIEIERSGSDGIDKMKVFCFDLMLAQLWANNHPTPGFLVHDSRIFDGVDERQRALALRLAQRESEARGFQYICTLNTDNVPQAELGPDFDLESFVRLRLSDRSPEESLLGIRF